MDAKLTTEMGAGVMLALGGPAAKILGLPVPDWLVIAGFVVGAMLFIYGIVGILRKRRKVASEGVTKGNYRLPIKLDEEWIKAVVLSRYWDSIALLGITPTMEDLLAWREQAVNQWKREHGYPVEDEKNDSNE